MDTKKLGILDAVCLRNEGAYCRMRLNDKGKPRQKAKFFGSRYSLGVTIYNID